MDMPVMIPLSLALANNATAPATTRSGRRASSAPTPPPYHHQIILILILNIPTLMPMSPAGVQPFPSAPARNSRPRLHGSAAFHVHHPLTNVSTYTPITLDDTNYRTYHQAHKPPLPSLHTSAPSTPHLSRYCKSTTTTIPTAAVITTATITTRSTMTTVNYRTRAQAEVCRGKYRTQARLCYQVRPFSHRSLIVR